MTAHTLERAARRADAALRRFSRQAPIDQEFTMPALHTDDTALAQILNADDGDHLVITFGRGRCIGITVEDEFDVELADYTGMDLTPAARFAAEALPVQPGASSSHPVIVWRPWS